mmetsp:Transcript_34331/g.79403  ORF Transcript_34331/g.79403 Transcript_34331/m.79403 type:complete len:81 (+) Transcript_34331:1875-2117(+)
MLCLYQKFDNEKYQDRGADDDIRPWVNQFFDNYGAKQSIQLLEGVGVVESPPNILATQAEAQSLKLAEAQKRTHVSLARP